MILIKSQLTEKQVVYIVKTIFTIMEVIFIESWQHQYLRSDSVALQVSEVALVQQ